MVLLFEPQSTVATRANFCVLILEKKEKKYAFRLALWVHLLCQRWYNTWVQTKIDYASFQAAYSHCSLHQINVDFGVTQSSSTSIAGHHPGFNISHWLLSHQIDGKALVHLNTNGVISVAYGNTDPSSRFELWPQILSQDGSRKKNRFGQQIVWACAQMMVPFIYETLHLSDELASFCLPTNLALR